MNEDQKHDGTTTVAVSMTQAQLRKATLKVFDAMDQIQHDGHTVDETIMAAAWAVGAAIAARGGVLLLDRPLREALQPLVAGYQAGRKQRQQS